MIQRGFLGHAKNAESTMKVTENIVKNAALKNLLMTIRNFRRLFGKKLGLLFLLTSAFTLCVTIFPISREPPLSSYEGKGVLQILELMPQKDKKRLEYFFRECIACDAMGFVIFGDKPMALSGKDKKISPLNSLSSFVYTMSPRRIRSKNGFDTWKKYEKFFPMKRFVFLYEETDFEENSLFINKKSFLQKVEQHANDFKTVLKRNATGEELLREGLNRPFLSEV
jgi:hypothetical protein